MTSPNLILQFSYFKCEVIEECCYGSVVRSVLHPAKMACGFLVIFLSFLIFCYFTNERYAAAKFKRDHPVLGIVLVLSGGYFVTYMLGAVLVFLFGILLPFSG